MSKLDEAMKKYLGKSGGSEAQESKLDRALAKYLGGDQEETIDPAERAQKRYELEMGMATSPLNGFAQPTNDFIKAQEQVARDQERMRKDQEIMQKDMEILASWPEEDQAMLREYAKNRTSGSGTVTGQREWQTQVEEDLLNELTEKYNIDEIERLAESYTRYANAERTQTVEGKTDAMMSHWFPGLGANAMSIPANILGGVTGTVQRAAEMKDRTGRYSTLDPNSAASIPTQFAGQVRGETARAIRGENGNGFRNVAAMGYSGVMSAADSLARIYLGGGSKALSLGLAGLSSFDSTVTEASKRGATPKQALVMGAADAGLEVATEYLPLERWFNVAEGAGASGVKELLKSAAKQAGVEIASEEVNLLASLMVEGAVLKDKSEYNQAVTQLMAQGKSGEEAARIANRNVWDQMVETAVASGISGGLMDLGGHLVGRGNANPQYLGPQNDVSENTNATEQATPKESLGVEQETPKTEQTPVEAEQATTEAAVKAAEKATTEKPSAVEQEGPKVEQEQPKTPPRQSPTEREIIEDTIYDILEGKTQGTDIDSAMDMVDSILRETVDQSEQSAEQAQADREGAMETIEKLGSKHDATGRMIAELFPELGQTTAETMAEPRVEAQTEPRVENQGKPAADQGKTATWKYQSISPDASYFAPGGDGGFTVTEDGRVIPDETQTKGVATRNGWANRGFEYLYDISGDASGFVGIRILSDPVVRQNGVGNYILESKGKAEYISAEEASRADAKTAPKTDTDVIAGILSDEGIRNPEITQEWKPEGTVSETETVDASEGFNEFGTDEHRSVGSAGAGFSPFSEAEDIYGTIPERYLEDDVTVRPDDVPRSMDGETKVSYVARTLKGAEITPDSLVEDLENKVVQNGMSYVPITNSETTQKAAENIAKLGWDEALAKWRSDVRAKKTGADMTATGAILLNNAAAAGDKALWLDLLGDMQQLGTNTAQGLQAFKIIKQLKPDDKLYMMRKSVERMVDELGLDSDIEIDEDLAKEYQDAETPEDADKAIEKIQEAIAKQIPPTLWDKWNALRYLNMLGNFKTQVRNVSGNVAMQAAYKVKDKVATALEAIFLPKAERTKSFAVSRKLLKAARADFQHFADLIVEGGKYGKENTSQEFERGIENKRRIFKFKPLEAYRKATQWAMNNEQFGDAAFAKSAYARAMAGFLKARGFKGTSLDDVSPALLDQARLYAIKEAQEATFHDNNAVSSWISKIGRRPDTPKAAKIVSEGIMPFRKTPANVLVRAEEFSPLGLINSAVETVKAAKGNASGADVVNSWAKSLTGTGLAALGYFLAKYGILNGGPDDDDEREAFDRMTGEQNYSLNLPGGYNMTIDFLSPTAMPMLLGAQLSKAQDMTDLTMKDMEKVFLSLADPMIQMSMLQGLNDTIDKVKFSEDNMGQFLLDSIMGYLSQGLTNTLLGQLERSGEDSRMTTYVDDDSFLSPWAQRQLGKASAKTPGADFQQIPYLNAWGEEEKNPKGLAGYAYQLLSPSYISKDSKDPLNEELKRLDSTQSDVNVFPRKADRKITYNGTSGERHENYALSAEEWTTMQKTQGQTAKQLLNEIIKTDAYKGMTDAEKAKTVSIVYDYAREKGKQAALPDYDPQMGGRLGYLETAMDAGIDPGEFFRHYSRYSEINQSDAETGDKALQWSTYLQEQTEKGAISKAQRDVLKDTMGFRYSMPAETQKYDEMTASGLESDEANAILDVLSGLAPQEGYTEVRAAQKYEAIADSNLSESDKEAVLRIYMDDNQESKMDKAMSAGLTASQYVEAYAAYSQTHTKKDGIEAIAKALGLTDGDAKYLYEIIRPPRR